MQKAILFIPDITGFTEFVHHTDISHSKHIIKELLELLLDKNVINLELAEIEGDALFLYKLQNTIELDNIEYQIQQMYVAFHAHLKRYEFERICHCGACSSAYNLHLKFVVHYGEIDFITIKNYEKPYGSNVIQAHRLLKNNVPIKEYALFTDSVLTLNGGNQNTKNSIEYDFGKISFSYKPLEYLKKEIPKVKPIPDIVPKHKLFEKSFTVHSNMDDLYEIVSNFEYRQFWTTGIDKLEYDKNKVNRIGEKHRCLINNREIEQTTISKKKGSNQLVYGETTEDIPLIKKMSMYFILEQGNENVVNLNIEAYVDFKHFGIFIKPFFKKNFKKVVIENVKALILLAETDFIETKHNT